MRKKDDFDVATIVKYGVASFSSWSKSICNGEMGITRIGGPRMNIAFFQRLTPSAGADKASWHLFPPPPRASPWALTWLVENIRSPKHPNYYQV